MDLRHKIWNSNLLLFVANTRDPLVFRRLMGEKLSLKEKIIVALCNLVLRIVMPRPTRLPKEVRRAIKNAQKLLKKKKPQSRISP